MRREAFRASALAAMVALTTTGGCLLVTPLGDVAAGGTSNAGKGSTDPGGEAGTEGGAGGTPSDGECRTNADCAPLGAGAPYRCLPSSHTCAPLLSEACPLSYGEDWADPNALYFGAFAALTPVRPEDNSIVWSYRLALNELNGQSIGGLPDGPRNARRPLVMLVCNNAEAQVENAVTHLTEELEIPAVLATLKPADLRLAYEAHRDTFFLSPVAVSSNVASESDDGHIWNLLGQPSDFAPAYAALLARAETHVRDVRNLASDTPLKLALVTTNDAFGRELADAITPLLRVNGKAATADAAHFKLFEIGQDPNPEAEATPIGEFQPDIIVSTANEAFTLKGGVQEQLESDWEAYTIPEPANPRPFYILSPYNAGNLSPLVDRINGRLDAQPDVQDQQRYVGVSIAAAPDSSLQNAYEVRLASAFSKAFGDTANYYDSVYYLAYAMFGANEPNGVTGAGLVRGMRRLLDGSGFDVGPTDANRIFAALRAKDATVNLASTLGPPGFDAETGVRPITASVFCFSRTKNEVEPLPDQLRYENDELVGDLSCIPEF